MKNGCEIHWTLNALTELEQTIEYLQNNFTEKEISKLALETEETIRLISQNQNFSKNQIGVRHYIILFFLSILFLSGWAQNEDSLFPVFPDCENTTTKKLKFCFYKTLEDLIVNNFRWSEIEGDYQDKFSVNFEVSDEGSFKLMEFKESVDELRFEFSYIFSLLPSITPVKINSENQTTYYQLSFELISSEEQIKNINFEVINIEDLEIAFAVIEKVPVYPGCELEINNKSLKDCMSKKVAEHINQRFNINLANSMNLQGIQRILVQFKIDHLGFVTDVRARGPNPRLEEEVRLIVMSLPKMIPGEQRGKPVGVLYSLPIVFKVVDD